MYDYDKAIETIKAVSGYESNAEYTKALEEYDLEKSRLFQWNDNYTITHIFFHTLIVDPEKTFDVSLSSKAQVIAYNEAMTTIDEFVKIIQKMYDDGYVLVGLHDVGNGNSARWNTDHADEADLSSSRKNTICAVTG